MIDCRLLRYFFVLAAAVLVVLPFPAWSHARRDPILLFKRSNDTESEIGGTKLRLTAQGAAFLEGLQGPFAIVAIVGPTRTGKSFLLNQIAHAAGDPEEQLESEASTKPFAVGGGVVSKTHGAWIWPEPVNLGSVPTYLMDSEGLHGVESVQTAAYEVELFVHAAMLASTVVYNTWAPVDAANVRTLKSLVAFSRLFMMDVAAAVVDTDNQTTTAGGEQSFDTSAIPEHLDPPSLHWTVQNFNKFSLEHGGVNATEFLDQLIRKDSFLQDANVDFRFLKQQFSYMDLIPMSRPSDEDEKLAGDGSNISWADFRKPYQSDVMSLVDSLRAHLTPKRLNGKNLSGADLVQLIRQWDREVPIQIPEHTSWHKAVQLKLEHEAHRLLKDFELEGSQVNVSRHSGNYASYANNLHKLADMKLGKMQSSVKKLGDDPGATMVLAYLATELLARERKFLDAYLSWAWKEALKEGDELHEEEMARLNELRDAPERICKWWFASNLEDALERRIRMERARVVESLAPHFPPNYSPEKLYQHVVEGSGSYTSRTAEIHSALKYILLEHAECPDHLRVLIEAIKPIWHRHHTAIKSTAGVVLATLVVRARRSILGLLSWLGSILLYYTIITLRAVLSRAWVMASYAVSITIICYTLWICTQVSILGRRRADIRYTWPGLLTEIDDAVEGVQGFAKGLIAFSVIVVPGVAVIAVPRLLRRLRKPRMTRVRIDLANDEYAQ
ncbi:guanylate-binding protein [Phlyctochytrium arcticum]|nr:guanylate-binding protein [Phlyctochytrium arcticum]